MFLFKTRIDTQSVWLQNLWWYWCYSRISLRPPCKRPALFELRVKAFLREGLESVTSVMMITVECPSNIHWVIEPTGSRSRSQFVILHLNNNTTATTAVRGWTYESQFMKVNIINVEKFHAKAVVRLFPSFRMVYEIFRHFLQLCCLH